MSSIAALQVQGELEDLSLPYAMKTEQNTPTTCSQSSECDLSSFNKDIGNIETASFTSMTGDEFDSTDMDDEAASLNTPRSARSNSLHDDDFPTAEEHFLAVYPIALLMQLRVACCAARGGSACKCNPAVRYGSKLESELPECYHRSEAAQPPVERNSCSWRVAAAASKAQKGKSGASNNSSKRGSESQPKPSISTLLPTSANSWAAQQAAKHLQNDDPSANDRNIERNARAILNKLTIEKFDRLYEQLAECGVRTQAHVAMIMEEIFEKATQQHHFIPMYADLCVKLERDPRIMPAVEVEESEGPKKTFRGLLLNQCQTSFEHMLASHGQEQDGPEDEEAKSLRKFKALGNVKFVGELIVRGMLCTRLLCTISEDLISNREGCVDALESLAALLTVAAPKFDDKQWLHFQRLSEIFNKLRELASDKSVPARIRFLLRDVIDARKAGWPNHGAIQDTKAKPMKIEEVHQVAAQEQAGAPQLIKRKSNPTIITKAGQDRDKELKEIIRRKLIISTSEPAPKPAPKLAPWAPSSPAAKPEAPPTPQGQDKPQERTTPARRCRGGKAARAKREKYLSQEEDQPASAPGSPALSAQDPTTTPPSTAMPSPMSSPVAALRSPEACEDLTPLASPRTPEFPIVEPASEPIAEPVTPVAFDLAAFHRELAPMLRSLGRTPAAIADAVQSICTKGVPVRYQAKEFADILTRASEESNGPRRRAAFAVAAGLATYEGAGAFGSVECISGIKTFFEDYADLCEEVTRLDLIVTAEMLPALRKTLSPEEILAVLPEDLRSA